MHWYREGTRQRSRSLYGCRTPGGVRVGRESLEPDVLRDIEAQHPDIAFDWKAVLDNRQVVDTTPEVRRPRKRRRSEDESQAAPETAAPKHREGGSKRSGERSSPHARSGEAGQAAPPAPASPKPPDGDVTSASATPRGGEGGPRPAIPSAIEGSTPDEQTAFLARWYPIIRDRIPQRTADPARREALMALAERMNPAAWTDADQIVAGLQQAAEALERLSRVFSKRRRRARKPPKANTGSATAAAPASPPPDTPSSES